ncbi:hypothetical protein QQS45_11805 [Alteriqipengyuania flavescens]|uniref:hypothetical protein n=1 Tax=Alteriqipengyuania flavescens TaxID=3053610 RepID=UPI0025B513DE|nr:hypothetical protein [Alteriqipengyuania flavescens]WJY24238.1 hypothetical protein QQS45_11805 [Alteriqipengyuania flavescens]
MSEVAIMPPIQFIRAHGLYMRAAEVGAASSLVVLLGALDQVPAWATQLALGPLLIAIGIMLYPTLRDEFAEKLWLRGLEAALNCAVALTLGPWIFGHGLNLIADAANVVHDDFSTAPALTGRIAGAIIIFAFFLGFHLRRLPGFK